MHITESSIITSYVGSVLIGAFNRIRTRIEFSDLPTSPRQPSSSSSDGSIAGSIGGFPLLPPSVEIGSTVSVAGVDVIAMEVDDDGVSVVTTDSVVEEAVKMTTDDNSPVAFEDVTMATDDKSLVAFEDVSIATDADDSVVNENVTPLCTASLLELASEVPVVTDNVCLSSDDFCVSDVCAIFVDVASCSDVVIVFDCVLMMTGGEFGPLRPALFTRETARQRVPGMAVWLPKALTRSRSDSLSGNGTGPGSLVTWSHG